MRSARARSAVLAVCLAASAWSCAEFFGRGSGDEQSARLSAGPSSSAPIVGVCPPGFGDCDDNPENGCETEFEPWENACTRCDPACSAGFVCHGGVCRDADPTVKVAAGGSHTCALRRSGAVVCWGANEEGQLGDGTTIGRSRPVRTRNITDAIDVAAGESHTCAVRASGAVACWGDNSIRQLGHDLGDESPLPSPVPGVRDAVQITAAVVHTCALLFNGKAMCWGSGESGQLGDGTVDRRSLPPSLVQWPQTQILQISAGSTHTCAINRQGVAACWGRNEQGQLGDGMIAPQRPIPAVLRGLSQPIQIAAGAIHSCAVRVKGDVMCWGDNAQGALGNPSAGSISSKPVPVPGLSDVVQVEVGWKHSCARLSGGEVLCWGDNHVGQLGTQDPLRQMRPAKVGLSAHATWISSGRNHTCAVLETHGVVCWGENTRGQLGDGTRRNRPIPTPVAGLY
jgi:alpha-tubulin suppressor-like RCC1 family protein